MPDSLNNHSHTSNSRTVRFKSLLDDLKRRFHQPLKRSHALVDKKLADKDSADDTLLIVSTASQTLFVIKNQRLDSQFSISTAEKGTGNQMGSNQTPLGLHVIKEKFGDNAPLASVFKGRAKTGQIATILKDTDTKSTEDNITSRILWLDGLEEGINKGNDKQGNNVDSYSRYIYIHGTDEEGRLGEKASHGCIRMANSDVIALYNEIETGCLVFITDLLITDI